MTARQPLVPPLPLPPKEYDARHMAELDAMIRTGFLDMNRVVQEIEAAGITRIQDATDYLGGIEDPGDVLTWTDGGGGFWYPAAPVTPDLADLGDVSLSSPASDEVLTYNGSAWVNAAAAAGSSDLMDWTSYTGNPTTDQWYEDPLMVTLTETGFYAVEGFLRAYATSTTDIRLRAYYKSTGSGVITFAANGAYVNSWTSVSEGTTGLVMNYTSAGLEQIIIRGYLDATSISGTPEFSIDFKRGTGTTDSTYISYGWLKLVRIGDT